MQPPKIILCHCVCLWPWCFLNIQRSLTPTRTETHRVLELDGRIQKPLSWPLYLSPSNPQLKTYNSFLSSEFLVQSYGKERLNSHRNHTQPSPPSFPGTQYFNTGQEAGRVCEWEPHPAAVHLELLPFQHGSEPTYLFTPEARASGLPPPWLLLFHPSTLTQDWHKLREQVVLKKCKKVSGIPVSQNNVRYVTVREQEAERCMKLSAIFDKCATSHMTHG